MQERAVLLRELRANELGRSVHRFDLPLVLWLMSPFASMTAGEGNGLSFFFFFFSVFFLFHDQTRVSSRHVRGKERAAEENRGLHNRSLLWKQRRCFARARMQSGFKTARYSYSYSYVYFLIKNDNTQQIQLHQIAFYSFSSLLVVFRASLLMNLFCYFSFNQSFWSTDCQKKIFTSHFVDN